MAAGAMLEARKRGIRVPEDLAIAGFGDLDFAAHLQPPLTSIRVPGYEIGRVAGRLLLARLRSNEIIDQTTIVPVQLVERESTTLHA